jgi:hypothetical protein
MLVSSAYGAPTNDCFRPTPAGSSHWSASVQSNLNTLSVPTTRSRDLLTTTDTTVTDFTTVTTTVTTVTNYCHYCYYCYYHYYDYHYDYDYHYYYYY